MDFSTEKPPAEVNKIQLEDISWNRTMERHRCCSVVEPSTTHSANGKRLSDRASSLRSKTFNQTLQVFRDSDAAKKFFKRRIKMLSNVAGVMGLLSAILALADIELTMKSSIPSENASQSTLEEILDDPYRLAAAVVKSTLSVCSVLTCMTIYRIYMNDFSYLIVRNIYHESEKFVMTSLFASCLLESLVCLFHVPPLLDHYGLPFELQLVVFIRLYLVAKYVKEHNMFVNNQATALFASVTKTEISSMFLVKSYFLKYPFRLIATFYTLNVFLGGYVVYVIDRPHNSYLDTVWMLVVTMTTLGFGDIVPKAILARAIVGLASVLGIFLMALFISVVHENLQLKQQEKRVLAVMENAEHLAEKKNLAASCIQSLWRSHNFSTINKEALMRGDWLKHNKLVLLRHKMEEHVRRWRIVRRSWSRDDYWRKFFLADDIAMLLTDVSRSVANVENYLEKQSGGRRASKMSLNKRSSVCSPPPILEEKPMSPPPDNDKTRTVNGNGDPAFRPLYISSRPPLTQVHPATSRGMIPLRYNYVDKSPNGPVNHVQNEKFSELGENGRKTITPRTRRENDSIDRGFTTRLESFEKALDAIYFKMKTELRDVRDSVNRPSRSPLGSNIPSPKAAPRRTDVDFYNYACATDNLDV